MHNSGGMLESFGEGRQRVFIYFELGRKGVRRGTFNEELFVGSHDIVDCLAIAGKQ